MIVHCFEPIVNKQSRVLILGSMPGKESLRKQQYYGHKQNAFWRLMCTLLEEPFVYDYDARLDMLRAHKLALWDVVQSCERTSSLDADIKKPIINCFDAFFVAHPHIRHVFFNGAKAHELFSRHVGFGFTGLGFTRLGSTSPAHAVSFSARLNDWQCLLPYLKDNSRK